LVVPAKNDLLRADHASETFVRGRFHAAQRQCESSSKKYSNALSEPRPFVRSRLEPRYGSIKGDNHEQDVPSRSLRNAGGRQEPHGGVLPKGLRLEDANARPGDGRLCAVTTAESNAKPGAPAGAINGFFPKKPDWPAQYHPVVIAVDDIKFAARRVEEAGGAHGDTERWRYVAFFDTEGNRASMLHPNRS
jgi:hypothetical protein